MAQKKSKDDSLAFMSRLSDWVYYHDPKLPHDPAHPHLILFLSWMSARKAHIEKYTAQHQILYPSSRILLVTYTPSSMFVNKHDKLLRPAAEILKEEAERAQGSEEVRMLIHLFSNGGAAHARHLFNNLRGISGGELTIPKHVMVLDSSPGYLHWSTAYAAMAAVTPIWARPLIHLWIFLGFVLWKPFARSHYNKDNVEALRSEDLLRQETARLYVYGTGDVMVRWQDVEDDAGWVKRETRTEVRTERFEGAQHVSHARMDFERYWGAVSKLWEERDAK
ncbi:hypothetical protein LIA77_11057 [Sarocladium implicatum]|nr:hypothetical protein LIA77_11057 [Sarocladium implicatum]